MTKHEEFLKERQYLKNVSPKTIDWHKWSLAWLGVEGPCEKGLKQVVIRMRERGLKASSCNTRARSIQCLFDLARFASSNSENEGRRILAGNVLTG
jgi:hypothetical protein